MRKTRSGAAIKNSLRAGARALGVVRSRWYPGLGAGRKSRFPGILRLDAAAVRQSQRTRVRQDPGLLRRPLGLRAPVVRPRAGRGGEGTQRVHTRLLPSGAGSLHRGDGDEAVARDQEESEDPRAAPALSARSGQALLSPGHRATRAALPPAACFVTTRLRSTPGRVADVYLRREEIAARVAELGAEIAGDYAGRNPL